MRVLLVDVDSKIPNLALMKISAYHKLLGDDVGFDVNNPDKVYISCIFSKNAEQTRGVAKYYPDAEIDIGGCGINLTKKLIPEIELIRPDYDLYLSTYSQGYTSRGCPRECEFCIVPKKEGKIKIAQHPSEFHDEKFDTCMIMDNNLFAAPKRWQWDVFKWFHNNKIKMLSPQGWDARLLTEECAGFLKLVKHAGQIHFAWDNIKDEEKIKDAIDLLRSAGHNLRSDITFYVLCGFGMSFGKPIQIPFSEDDSYRCEKLKEWGTNAFVMPYHKKDKRINELARWANRPWLYWSTSFEKYRKVRK